MPKKPRFELRLRFVSEAAKLERLMSKATRQSLVRTAGFTRTAMKNLLGKRGKKIGKRGNARAPSAPGSPPHRITGILRRLVFWGFDEASWTVVIGPLVRGKGIVPKLHDRGGAQNFHNRFTGTVVRAVYPPRPYSEQAREKATHDLDRAWRDSLSKAT